MSQDAFSANMQERIAQAVMAAAGVASASEYKLTTSTAGFLELTKINPHNRTRYVLPCVFSGHQLHIKSVLKAWQGKRYSTTKESFLVNGQANQGFTEVAHYGHSGRCVAYAPLNRCTWLVTTTAREALAAQYQNWGISQDPEQWTLTMFDENDNESKLLLTEPVLEQA